MDCCTPDCGCDEEEAPVEIAEEVVDPAEETIEEPETEEEDVFIVNEPDEEPVVVEEEPDIELDPVSEPVIVASSPEPADLPTDVKKDISDELCELPWNLPDTTV